jgi:hypothetical protein
MSVALYLVLFFSVALILCALFLPVRLHLVLSEKTKSVSLGWLFLMGRADLVSKTFELRLFHHRIISRKMEKKPKEKAKEIKEVIKKKKGRGFEILDLWREKDLLLKVLTVVFRFLRDVLKSIRFNKLCLQGDIATPDPALTGTIYGGLCPVCASVNSISPNFRLEVRPDFVNEIPRGRAEVALSTRLINTFGATLRMFFALPKIRIVRTILKMKRR